MFLWHLRKMKILIMDSAAVTVAYLVTDDSQKWTIIRCGIDSYSLVLESGAKHYFSSIQQDPKNLIFEGGVGIGLKEVYKLQPHSQRCPNWTISRWVNSNRHEFDLEKDSWDLKFRYTAIPVMASGGLEEETKINT